jgi:hypothetical protein
MTPFALLTRLCGLSPREAAAVLKVRPDTVNSWITGRRSPSPAILTELVKLLRVIEGVAAAALETVREQPASQIGGAIVELGFCADDAEAQNLGFPCAGAHAAMLARVAAGLIEAGQEIRLVPRGSTVATALAADQREA